MTLRTAWLCAALAAGLAGGERPEVNPTAVAIAKRTGYAPVVPTLADDTLKSPDDPPPVWLRVQPSPVPDGRPIVSHHVFHSKLMGFDIGYNIFLPPQYEQESSRRYPVLYWMHGRDGNEYKDIGHTLHYYRAMVKGSLDPMIVVYANGIARSAYMNSIDGRFPVESMIITELIPHVENSYRAQGTREGRFVGGMSMGGAGCLHLAFKYPELFSAVIAYGAALHTPEDGERLTALAQRLGSDDVSRILPELPGALARSNVARIANRMGIRIVCGSRDPLLAKNRRLHEYLSDLGIGHDYEELWPYGHDIGGMVARAGVEGLQFALAAARRLGRGGK